MDTKKKISVTIFGSSGKIGSSLAQKYLEDGNNLNLFYRNTKNKNFLEKKFNINKHQSKIKLIKYNFSNQNQLKKDIKKNKNVFMRTDILILTIGEQGEIKNFFKQNIKKFFNTFYINFFFYFLLSKNLIQVLNNKSKMLIILFSGGGSTSYRENFSSYSLTKVSLVKLTEIMSYEVKNKNIRFNILSPGIINSNMTKKILKQRDKVSRVEINKINKNLKFSEINISKIYKTVNFLNSKRGNKISGKLISSTWDQVLSLKTKDIKNLIKSDIFTLRRKEV